MAVAKEEAAVVKAKEVVLRQARADIVSAPTVVKEQPIKRGVLAMNKNAQNAELPCHGNRFWHYLIVFEKGANSGL